VLFVSFVVKNKNENCLHGGKKRERMGNVVEIPGENVILVV